MSKILHIIPSMSELRGGTTYAVFGITKALRSCQVDAEILTTNDDGPGVLNVPCGQFIDYQGVPILFLNRFSTPIHALSEYAMSPELIPWLNANISRYSLIHIHSLFSYVCTFSARTATRKSVPYIISPHGHFSPWVIHQKELKKRIYAFLLENRNLKQASLIHCTTIKEEKYVRDFGIDTPTVNIPLGIDLTETYKNAKSEIRKKYNLSAGKDTPIVLFLSRIHPKKRLEFLIESLGSIKDKSNFHLMIGGTGDAPYCREIEELIATLELQEKVTFTGFVTGQDKQLLLYGCDLFALPSLGENFGIAVAEAMEAGLPVAITPEVELAGDVLAGNAGLVMPGDLELWKKGLHQLISSPDLRRKMGDNGQKLSRTRYNWNAIGPQFVGAYESIFQSKSRKFERDDTN